MSDKDEAKLNESNSSDAKKSLSKNKGGIDTLNDSNNSKNNENDGALASSENRVTIPPPPPPSSTAKTPTPSQPSPPPQPSSISASQTTAKPTTASQTTAKPTTASQTTAKPTTVPSPSAPPSNTGTQKTAIPEGSDSIVQGNHAYDKSQRAVESGVGNSVGENEGKKGQTLPVANITSNYFCFDCGAIMTTIEDKEQHLLIESERRNNGESEGSD